VVAVSDEIVTARTSAVRTPDRSRNPRRKTEEKLSTAPCEGRLAFSTLWTKSSVEGGLSQP
jgi:hypothetical protein